VKKWSEHNRRYHRGDVPDRNTEYLFYQTLVGAWPIDVDRATNYLEKAIREAKMHTSWTHKNADYEAGIRAFAEGIMKDGEFIADLERFVQDLATPGRLNSLAQILLKLTAPGIPDIYQGTELWDMSLVDPDNRRPVDFTLRRRLLGELMGLSPEEILARSDKGMPKLWLIKQALHLRRELPDCFGPKGAYHPLYARGDRADHVLAFMRCESVISVIPRLVLGLTGNWKNTALDLPMGNWKNILTGDEWAAGSVRLSEMLARFPVALLERQ
jgi:(1->4)-alpha-D-glucan 1-alpha-D-glucosylmutase